MRFPSWFSSRAWLIVLLVACGFLGWTSLVRMRRVEFVSNLPVASATVDAASPTGYAGGIRMLVVPEHNAASYQWIVQTQQALTRGEWRLRHADYDNAPEGRDVHAPSPYRWWLEVVAWSQHLVSGAPLGVAVENAALLADPLLHALLLVSVTLFAARQIGTAAAVGVAVGLALMFPLAGEFLPGQPENLSLAYVCVLWSVLPLIAARRPRQSFALAGVAGGLGMWVDVGTQIPMLAGIALGGILAAWLARRSRSDGTTPGAIALPWRAWAISGATTTLAAYLLEYFPGHLQVAALRLEVNHPLYALAWLGGGELLARGTDWIGRGRPTWDRRSLVIVSLAFLAVAAVPVTMLLHPTRGFLAADGAAGRLSKLPDGAVAKNLFDWIARDGPDATLAALLPVLALLAVTAWLLTRSTVAPVRRSTVALTLGPVLVAFGFAGFRLQWWSALDCALVVLVAAGAVVLQEAVSRSVGRWLIAGGFTLALAPGVWRLTSSLSDATDPALSESEAQSVLERDLAHWLARQTGSDGAVVLAPPGLTSSLIYFGGARGVGTPYWENYEGFAATARIAAATSLAEAESLLRRRGVTHVLTPSWNSDLDDFARLATNEPDTALAGLLRRWHPPRWLRPVPYQTPSMEGLAERSVGIFALVDVQEDVTALSRLAEYFVETGRLEFAARVSHTIEEKYPTDLGGIVARAQVAAGRKDAAGFAAEFKSLLEGVTRGEDLGLPWDRRVNLAIMLALGQRTDLARTQLQRCLEEIDETLLRSLTTLTLFNLQLLARGLGQEIADPALRELALQLLPAERREKLR